MSRHFMPEVLLLLKQQGYTARPKDAGGYQIQSPPGGSPDYRSFSIVEPENGRDEQVIRNRLRRAGVKFPEDTPERSQKPMVADSPNCPPPPRPAKPLSPKTEHDHFEEIRVLADVVMTALGEILELVGRVEKTSKETEPLRQILQPGQAEKLRELLNGIE